MAITYSIAPNPHWVIIDNFSKLPPGAAIYTYSSLPPNDFKPAFQDSGGTIPYSQPITGFGNGTMPPIFWEFDSSNPTDLYYIRVYDSADPLTQNFLWDFNGLTGSGSGGGGGTITTAIDVENLVINGEFYRNTGNPVGVSIPTLITLAPSNNAGFVNDPTNGNGPTSPDIIFAKSDQSANDSLSFNLVNPVGQNFPGSLAQNPMPQIFVNYTTSVAGSESFKYIQFPICKGLQNLSNITASFQIFARYGSGNMGISLSLRQFFGSGTNGPSADVLTTLGTLSLLPGTWTATQFTSVVIPSINGKTIGNCGNDALYLQIVFPSSVLINLDFILPSMYLGNTVSTIDFHTLDQVDAIVNSPRTGDIRTSLNAFIPGWVKMDDGTVGSAGSAATNRANIDVFPLYDLIWNSISNPSANALCPVVGGLGVSSIADFAGNKPITLSKAAGRVLAGVNGSHALATPVGAETYALLANDLPAHVHPAPGGGKFVIDQSAGSITLAGGGSNTTTQTNTGNNSTANNPISLFQPTTFMNVFIKL